MSNTTKVVYGENTINVAAGTSLAEVKASMARIFPELKSAEPVLRGEEIHFEVKAGTKGAGETQKVVYGENVINVAVGTSLAEVKASMSRIFPELKSAEPVLRGSEIHFEVKAGTKGSDTLKVVYGENTINVAAGTSLAEVKASMSRIFPELKSAEPVLRGSEIHFEVKAGTKGSDTLKVVYGENTINVAAGTSLAEVKASMARIFPELKSAEPVLRGAEIHFEVKAGTKGSDTLKVVYGENTINVAAGTSLAEVKASMSRIFPELKSAEPVLRGSEIHFEVKAGTKGKLAK